MDIHSSDWINEVSFAEDGLIPAIAQDFKTGRILMVAWMNRDSLMQTVSTERATYWSRTRNKLWRKGEESGHEQVVKEVQLDCDADVLILQVNQSGGIACHTGRNSCFFRKLTPDGWQETEPVLKDPKEIYDNG